MAASVGREHTVSVVRVRVIAVTPNAYYLQGGSRDIFLDISGHGELTALCTVIRKERLAAGKEWIISIDHEYR